VDAGAFVVKSRIEGTKEVVKLEDVTAGWLKARLDKAHDTLFEKAQAYRAANTRDVSTYDEFKQVIKEQGGFVRCYFKPDREAEAKIKEQTKATVRCIPFEQQGTAGKCIFSGEETTNAGAVRAGVLTVEQLPPQRGRNSDSPG